MGVLGGTVGNMHGGQVCGRGGGAKERRGEGEGSKCSQAGIGGTGKTHDSGVRWERSLRFREGPAAAGSMCKRGRQHTLREMQHCGNRGSCGRKQQLQYGGWGHVCRLPWRGGGSCAVSAGTRMYAVEV